MTVLGMTESKIVQAVGTAGPSFRTEPSWFPGFWRVYDKRTNKTIGYCWGEKNARRETARLNGYRWP